MTTHLETLARRSGVVLAAGGVLALACVASAGPASARVPVGFSEPDQVSFGYVVLVLVAIPLALFVIIAALVYVPSLVRGERVAPGPAPDPENQWLGGPRRGAAELPAPDTEASQAGGSSARW